MISRAIFVGQVDPYRLALFLDFGTAAGNLAG